MTTTIRRPRAQVSPALSNAPSPEAPPCGSAVHQQDKSPLQRALAAAVGTTGLKKRDVTVGGRRTSMKLDDTTWTALTTVARLEGMSVDDIVTQVDQQIAPTQTLTVAIRVFVVEYLTSPSPRSCT